MDSEITYKPMQTILPPVDPAISFNAALYWLDGQFLFRFKEEGAWKAKFVTAQDAAAAFTGNEVDTGWLPAGIVRTGSSRLGRWFVYSSPPQKVKIIFDGEVEPVNIPLPRLVLVGAGQKYYIWATDTLHFSPTAVAFHAPFPNVHDDGLICWGATTPPQANPEKARGVWDLFFSTPFNDHLVGGKSKKESTDVRTQLRALANEKKYPIDDLMLSSRSIYNLVNAAIGVR